MRVSKSKMAELAKLTPEEAMKELSKIREEYNAKMREWRSKQGQKHKDRHAKLQRKWRKKNPERAREIHAEWEARNPGKSREAKLKWSEKRRREGRKETPEAHKTHNARWYSRNKAVKLVNTDPATVRKMIAKQLPGYLTAETRNDIINEVIQAILARKVLFEEIQSCAKPFVTAHNRMFDHFKNVSIDAPIAGTEDFKLIDTIASDAFHF